MTAYYNEPDPVAAEWLRRLIAADIIAPGEVDERDVRDVTPAELVRFTQCHFFAGVGMWSGALRAAGWADDRPIWTGSCPCQPFSTAGAGAGFTDDRHLWPHWHWLIEQRRPRVVVGEQVTGKDGLGWNDLVSADMAGSGYAFGSVDLAAAGFGVGWRGSAESERLERALRLCPDPMVARHLGAFADWADQSLCIDGFHIRQRQYIVGLANAAGARREGRQDARADRKGAGDIESDNGRGAAGPVQSQRGRAAGGMVNGQRPGLEGFGGDGDPAAGREPGSARSVAAASATGGMADGKGRGRGKRGDAMGAGQGRYIDGGRDSSSRMADADGGNASAERQQSGGQQRLDSQDRGDGGARGHRVRGGVDRELGAGQDNGARGIADWLFCRDGVWRPVRPGSFVLADAAPGRVGKLRAYGNGLDFETATAFVSAVMEIIDDLGIDA